jgi:TolB-like protein
MIFSFGDCELDCSLYELRRGGKSCAIEPKAFDLLLYLVENRERVVTKDEIHEKVWKGRIVSEATLSSCINAARRAIGDSGKKQSYIRTLPRRGFRFVGDVEAQPARRSPVTANNISDDMFTRTDEKQFWSMVAADNHEAPRPSGYPSVAVLPFTNMSGDPKQEYFSDGITEDIITELSRFHGLLVIAPYSSFTYRGASINIGTIARELAVEYVLEGSVRRSGNRVRITAQLIDATSGNHIWAERYDRELADIFAVQDEVALSIVGALTVELEDEALARSRRKQPESLQAYEHWLRGKRLIWTAGEQNLQARQHFQRAIAVDPEFSRAHSDMAVTYQMEALDFPLPDDFRSAYESAFKCAQIALALDDADYRAHVALAWARLYRREYDLVKKHVERAIKLNPNDADTLAATAYLLASLGEPGEGVKCGELAIRLNPRHPDWYYAYLSFALFLARRHDEGIIARSRAPNTFIDSNFLGAACYAQMDRLDEARQRTERGLVRLAATPGGALAIAEGRVVDALLENNPMRRKEDIDHFAECMRKAGVPG